MKLTSPAYPHGGTIPARFATIHVTGGTGTSIPLSWDDPPDTTRSFVLTTIDTHPVAHGWVHWLVTDIPPEIRKLREGASGSLLMPFPSVEMPNTGGRMGYGGPQPPVGSGVHDYVSTLYALEVPHLDIDPDATGDQVRDAMRGHIVDSAVVVGRFGR